MSVLLLLSSFSFYLAGLSGTLPSYRDSGDLIAASYTLGIAHPPGYALYILFGKAFVALVPFGNPAYRVTAMSALFGGLTIAFLFRVMRRLKGESIFVASVPAILFAATPAVIALSRVAEMYTLAACFAAGIVWCSLSDFPGRWMLGAFLIGLGISAHATVLFMAPFYAVLCWSSLRQETNVEKSVFLLILGFLLGISVVLFMPLRSAQEPWSNWGDPSHWRNFWRVVTRADYGGLRLHPEQSLFHWTPKSVATQLAFFIKLSVQEWGWAGVLLGLVGLVSGYRKTVSRTFTVGILLSWVVAGPGMFLLSNLPIDQATTPAILQPYMVLVNLLWAILIGFAFAEERLPWKAASLGAALLTFCVIKPWAAASNRHDMVAYDYARNLMRELPPNAVLFDPDDPTDFSLRALQVIERRRPDILTLSFFRTRWGYEQIRKRAPELFPPIPIQDGMELQRILRTYSIKQRPFYAELPQKLSPMRYFSAGLVYAVVPGATGDTSTPASRRHAESMMSQWVMRGNYRTNEQIDFFRSHVMSYYAAAHNNLGIEYAAVEEWPQAIRHYRAALAIEPDQAAAQKNLRIAEEALAQKRPQNRG